MSFLRASRGVHRRANTRTETFLPDMALYEFIVVMSATKVPLILTSSIELAAEEGFKAGWKA